MIICEYGEGVDILIIIRGDFRKEYSNANAAFNEIQVAREGGERGKSMAVKIVCVNILNTWIIAYLATK
ncbi:hypothetical protein NC651_031157 [Populus alba x Populus x berolinensis]|nr:hypothetical protein NC651_031157 [Populus alba x Populus x berolinensis]